MEEIKNRFKEQVFVSEAIRFHFNLRKPKSHKPTSIFMVVRVHCKQYKIPTGVKVLPEHWNMKMQVAYVGNRLSLLENSNNLIVNERLDALIRRFSDFLQYLCTAPEQIGNIDILKNYLYMGRSKKVEKTVIQHFKEWCWEKTDSSRPLYQKKVDWLERYINTRPDRESISFSIIATTKFFREFKEWLIVNMKARDGGGVKPETINETVKKVRTLLGKAVELEFITRTAYNDIVIVDLVDKSDVNIPFLYNSEVMQLFRHECKDATDAIVKDVFLLECTTGQRISDVKGLSGNIQEGENGLLILDLLTKKESTRVRVRLLFDLARKILIDKYHYDIPSISDNEINKRIKDIAKEAGLSREWIKTRHRVSDKTGKATENRQPLYKFITTHVGRHTFDCLLKMRGFSYEDIARYAGHNVDMVKRYTNNCTDVDIDNYELTKINNPANIVKLISEVDSPSTTPISTQKHELSDMGKILEFINARIDTYANMEQIIAESKDFIIKNNLDISWYGSSSFNTYRPKIKKQYDENYEQIIKILDAITTNQESVVPTTPIIYEIEEEQMEYAESMKDLIDAFGVMYENEHNRMNLITTEVNEDNLFTVKEKDFIVSCFERLGILFQLIVPSLHFLSLISQIRPTVAKGELPFDCFGAKTQMTYTDLFRLLKSIPKDAALTIIKELPLGMGAYSKLMKSFDDDDSDGFIQILVENGESLDNNVNAAGYFSLISSLYNYVLNSDEEKRPYVIDKEMSDIMGSELKAAYFDEPFAEIQEGKKLISTLMEGLLDAPDMDNRIKFLRGYPNLDIVLEDIDRYLRILCNGICQGINIARPNFLKSEVEAFKMILDRVSEGNIYAGKIQEALSPKIFLLRQDFFDKSNNPKLGDEYIGDAPACIIDGGVEKFSILLNHLGESGYIDNTSEVKNAFAYLMTGLCKPNPMPVVTWKKDLNVLGYILSLYPQGRQFSNAKKLIKGADGLHTATTLRGSNGEDRGFAKLIKELYGIEHDILKPKK